MKENGKGGEKCPEGGWKVEIKKGEIDLLIRMAVRVL